MRKAWRCAKNRCSSCDEAFLPGRFAARPRAQFERHQDGADRLRAGLSTQGLVVEGAFDRASGAGADELIEHGADAIFCANDASAAGALEVIKQRGLSVPNDVALAGFDDLSFAAELNPPLTTVRQGVQQQGMEAANVLFHLLRDPGSGPRRVILPTELVIRRSTVGEAGAS